MSHGRKRQGFTLVELLVVVAILATLFGLIVTGARSSGRSEVRRSAQSFAGAFLATQTRALESPLGAALLLESNGDPSDPNDWRHRQAVIARDANVLPLINTSSAPPTIDDAVQWCAIMPAMMPPPAPEDLMAGYRIRFTADGQTPGPWFAFLPSGEDLNGNGVLDPAEDLKISSVKGKNNALDAPLIAMRYEDGQTPGNTAWPSSQVLSYTVEIARHPRGGRASLEFPAAAAIDLRHSGCGNNPNAAWGRLDGKGIVGIEFDPRGFVRAVMQGVGKPAVDRTGRSATAGSVTDLRVQPLTPTEPIYFLVAPRNLIEADNLPPAHPDAAARSTLRSEAAVWVVLEPRTGRVTVSSNTPPPLDDQNPLLTARTAARASQQFGK